MCVPPLCPGATHRHHAMNSAAVLLYAFTSGELQSTLSLHTTSSPLYVPEVSVHTYTYAVPIVSNCSISISIHRYTVQVTIYKYVYIPIVSQCFYV